MGKINVPTTQAVFDALYEKNEWPIIQNREIFVFDGFAGADSRHTKSLPHRQRAAGQPESLYPPAFALRPTAGCDW
ncbi:MAG: hypothetical protein ACLSHO_11020 [Dysosmobacter sp.]